MNPGVIFESERLASQALELFVECLDSIGDLRALPVLIVRPYYPLVVALLALITMFSNNFAVVASELPIKPLYNFLTTHS